MDGRDLETDRSEDFFQKKWKALVCGEICQPVDNVDQPCTLKCRSETQEQELRLRGVRGSNRKNTDHRELSIH